MKSFSDFAFGLVSNHTRPIASTREVENSVEEERVDTQHKEKSSKEIYLRYQTRRNFILRQGSVLHFFFFSDALYILIYDFRYFN